MSRNKSTAAAQLPRIIDPQNVPVVFVDWFITAGIHQGVVNIALGTIDHSLTTPSDRMASVLVATRLRLTKEFAARMHRVLGNVLGIDAKIDDTDQTPPKNLH